MPKHKRPDTPALVPTSGREVQVRAEHYLSMFVAERDDGGYKVGPEIMEDPELLLAWARKHEPGSVFTDAEARHHAGNADGRYACYQPHVGVTR